MKSSSLKEVLTDPDEFITNSQLKTFSLELLARVDTDARNREVNDLHQLREKFKDIALKQEIAD